MNRSCPCLGGCTWPTRTGAWSRGCAGTSLSHSWERKEVLETPRPGFFSKHSSLVLHGDELFWGENRRVVLSDVKAPEISSDLFQHEEHVSTRDIDILVWYYRNKQQVWFDHEGKCAESITSTNVVYNVYYAFQSYLQHKVKTNPKLFRIHYICPLHRVWHRVYVVCCIRNIYNYVLTFFFKSMILSFNEDSVRGCELLWPVRLLRAASLPAP